MGASALNDAEIGAISGGEQSFYRGTGKTSPRAGLNNKVASGFINIIRRRPKSFIGLLVTLAFAIGGATFLASTNSLLAPALNEVITEVTDLQHAANSHRYMKLTQNILNGSETKPTLLGQWTGRKKYTYMSKSFQERLEKQGIKVNDSGSKRTLTFTNPDTGKSKTITADEFLSIYKNDVDFREAYTVAKRGRILGFFDQKANNLYRALGLSRNINSDYKQSNDADADKKKFRSTMTSEVAGGSNNVNSTTNRLTEETEYEKNPDGSTKVDPNTNEPIPKKDANGNIIKKLVNNAHSTTDGAGDTPTVKAQSYLVDVSSNIAGVADVGCAIMKTANMISVAIVANEVYQSIHYFMGLAESPSKMKYGYGSESPINSMLNFMTTSAEVEVEEASRSGNKIKTNGSPMEAQGMMKIMTGAPVDKEKTKHYSIERSFTAGGYTADKAKACSAIEGGAAIASGLAAIATSGGSVAATFIWKAVSGFALSATIAAALQFMIPFMAKSFFTNAFETAAGIPAGELYAKGAFAANTRVARTASSQSPSSASAVKDFSTFSKQVIALDAEVDRANRSPFDLTSRNTFFGSIAYNFATTTSTSFMGKIKNLIRNTSSSVATVIGNGATIATGENDYITTHGDCPLLDSIGAAGDIYCNPVTTADVSILDLMPSNDSYVAMINPNLKRVGDGFVSDNLECDAEGNCKIVENSLLERYVKYCNNRNSPFGAVDSNILGELAKDGGGLLDGIPLIGEADALLAAAQDANNLKWATGEVCVNTPDNPYWETFKYYQLYVQDQRLLEQMGAYEGSSSPIAALDEKSSTDAPASETPSSYLANISGLSEDDAELVLDLAYYYDFVENYDPSTRIALDGTTPGLAASDVVIANLDYTFRYRDFARQFESETDEYSRVAIVAEHIIYSDVRNRSFAA